MKRKMPIVEGVCYKHRRWSVEMARKAHEGDRYYMLRTGDDKAGIVWHEVFTSEPYEDKDWAGQGKQRHYMKMDCYDCVPADQKPPVDIEMLVLRK